MHTRERVRRGAAVVTGLAALLLAVLGCSVVHGFTAEYSGGTGLQVLPVVVVLPAAVALLATALWPGTSRRTLLLVPLAAALLLVVSGLAVDRLGERAHDRRLLEESRTFSCNGPNAEIEVDPRVDEVFAGLPRPAPLYGSIEGAPDGCTAGVSGDPAETFEAWAVALHGLDGWRVTRDEPGLLVVRRDDGLSVTLVRGGVTTLRVSTGPGGDVGQTSEEFVTGPNPATG